jgi:hypothetical protein
VRSRATRVAVAAVAALALSAAAGAGTAAAGQAQFTVKTNVRTCGVFVDAGKGGEEFVVFRRMVWQGGLLYCSGSFAGAAPWLDQADGNVMMVNRTTGETVGQPAFFYCRQTTECHNGASEGVLRRGDQQYVAQLDASFWLDGRTFCRRYE